MRSKRALHAAAVAVLFWAGAALAGSADLPDRYLSGLDGRPVSVVQPGTGITYSVWSFRGRGEFDLAVSSLDAKGSWSEPVFLGRSDERDQVTPALVADSHGTLYLAFAIRETAEIHVSMLPVGASSWTTPIVLTHGTERGFAPALAVVSNRLVVAWRGFGGTVEIRDLPLVAPSMAPRGINDGPDGIDPLGQTNGDSSGFLSPPAGKTPGGGPGK